ncbi:MAG: UbiD family decarboxylase [Candidatus Sumerlaeia bacterium]
MMTKPIRNLRQFLELLHSRKQLAVVSAPVDPDQELAEIHRRVIAEGGPALLFTNVRGSKFPVVTNLFGTPERVEWAFGERPFEMIARVAEMALEMPPSAGKIGRLMMEGLHIGLDRNRRGPILENRMQPAKLTELPFTKTWPDDGGAFLTLPLVLTHSPADGRANLGMYRMQRFDDATAGMHWQIGKGGGFHDYEAEQRGEALPVSVFLGGPPALILSAIAPLPHGVSELLLASLILGEKLDVVENPIGPRELIAEAEFALVGKVPPRERRPEGPFGDHYGYYSLKHDYPVFHCDAVFHRKDAIFPATVVGKPRQEDYFIGEYLQKLLKPVYPLAMPAVRELWSYGETGFHALAAAVVWERYGREAMSAAFRILGEGQLSFTKFLIATDTPRDLADFRALLEHVLARFHPETDLYIFSDLSMDTLDYTGPEVNKGSKGVMLGLGEACRELPREWSGEPPAGTREVAVFCPGCLVLGGPAYKSDDETDGHGGDSFPSLLAKNKRLLDWPLVVLCDKPGEAVSSTIRFLWTTFTRFEPAADVHSASVEIRRNHVVHRGPIVIDARMKPWYPGEVEVAPEIARKVEARWGELFKG